MTYIALKTHNMVNGCITKDNMSPQLLEFKILGDQDPLTHPNIALQGPNGTSLNAT